MDLLKLSPKQDVTEGINFVAENILLHHKEKHILIANVESLYEFISRMVTLQYNHIILSR